MGRPSTLSAESFNLGTGNVLAGFQTAAAGSAGSNIEIKRLEITQNGSTTLAMIRGEIATRDTAGTLTMTSTTPRVTRPIGGAASGLAGNTAPAGGTGRSGTNSSADSGGTYTNVRHFNFANLNGYIWVPDPETEIWVPPSTLIVVRLLATPGTTTGWTVVLDLDEN